MSVWFSFSFSFEAGWSVSIYANEKTGRIGREYRDNFGVVGGLSDS